MNTKMKYRMPNILEAFDILKIVRVNEGESADGLEIKKNLVSFVAGLVDYKEMGYESKEAILEDLEMFGHLARLADEVYAKVIEAFAKKD